MGCCQLTSHLVGVFITPRDGFCDIEPYREIIRRVSTGGPFANQPLSRRFLCGSSVACFLEASLQLIRQNGALFMNFIYIVTGTWWQLPIYAADWCSLHEFYQPSPPSMVRGSCSIFVKRGAWPFPSRGMEFPVWICLSYQLAASGGTYCSTRRVAPGSITSTLDTASEITHSYFYIWASACFYVIKPVQSTNLPSFS